MRLIQLLAIAIVIWLLYRMLRLSLEKKRHTDASHSASPDKVEHMVRCAKCGLHIPEHEALHRDDRFYCSPEHRDEDVSKDN